MNSRCIWDRAKARHNLAKHKVSFEEASTVFDDPNYLIKDDLDHSDEENRYIAIGYSLLERLLVVVYTERGSKTRIISSRKAETQERKIYEEGNI